MGFFDRLSEKKSNPPSSSAESSAGGVMPRLIAARECIEAQDLPAALAIYEEVLAVAGDRADVLVTISADLGVNGQVRELIELVAPRYDAERHGPATGLNLLQAYLAVRNTDAAQHVLDILFSLNRADLEERLHGFSNAIAEMIHADAQPSEASGAGALPEIKINLVTISKPMWFYGLEPLAEQILPPKSDRLRRVAFAQLAILGVPDLAERAKQPEDELGRLCRALPLWFAETFYFSPHYAPIASIGLLGPHYALFGLEWTTENIRQWIESSKGGFDYVFTGALQKNDDVFEVIIRVWEIKKYRERKQFTARWTAATADRELANLHEQIRLFMEWAPEKSGVLYTPPPSPRRWLETLGAAASLFLAEKNLLSKEQLPSMEAVLAAAGGDAAASESSALAFLALRNRAERLSLATRLEASLKNSPLVSQAERLS
jgi:hypothetical protein